MKACPVSGRGKVKMIFEVCTFRMLSRCVWAGTRQPCCGCEARHFSVTSGEEGVSHDLLQQGYSDTMTLAGVGWGGDPATGLPLAQCTG